MEKHAFCFQSSTDNEDTTQESIEMIISFVILRNWSLYSFKYLITLDTLIVWSFSRFGRGILYGDYRILRDRPFYQPQKRSQPLYK